MLSRVSPRARGFGRLLALGCFACLLLPLAAGAVVHPTSASALVCPLSASELSALVGKKVQRVDLSGGDDPGGQCSFSAIGKTPADKFTSPQVFLTVSPGAAADLRDLRLYYAKVGSKLQPPQRVASRPDIGSGAFTITVASAPITTIHFLIGKAIVATLVVDLSGAASGRRDPATADKILALLQSRF
jgi:hypothetical protein